MHDELKYLSVFLPDEVTLWEIGYLQQVITMQKRYKLETFTLDGKAVTTVDGMTIIPDGGLELAIGTDALVLPGSQVWTKNPLKPIQDLAVSFTNQGKLVAAICGGTIALAQSGLLDKRAHTSNTEKFLSFFAPAYQGSANYHDTPAVIDGTVVTACSAGGLLWAKVIVSFLHLLPPEATEAWYQYYLTGKASQYFKMMAAIRNNR